MKEANGYFLLEEGIAKIFFLKNNSKGSKIVNSSENSKQLRVLMTSASRGWVK